MTGENLNQEQLIQVELTDLVYKRLVDAGLISSNQEAKRLIKDKAIKIGFPGTKKKDGYPIKLTDTMELLYTAALRGYYLIIGKLWMEKMSLENPPKEEK